MARATVGWWCEPAAGTIRSRWHRTQRRQKHPEAEVENDSLGNGCLSDDSLSRGRLFGGNLLRKNHPVATLMFRFIQCAVGDPQELLDRVGIVRIHGDAD